MSKFIICILLLFILFSCSSSENNTNSTSIESDNSKVEIAVEKNSFEDFQTVLSSKIFDWTTEGCSNKEIELLKNGKNSEYWKVSSIEETKVVYESDFGIDRLEIKLLEGDSVNYLMTYTENQKLAKIEFWKIENDTLFPIDLIPSTLSVNDFFNEKDHINNPKEYIGNINYLMLDKNIQATLNTWLEPAFENKTVKYNVFLNWNGKQFEIVKKEKSN